MKSLIILFADNFSNYGFEKAFDGKNAFIKTLEWAEKIENSSDVEIFCFDSNEVLVKENIEEYTKEKNSQKKFNINKKENWNVENLFFELASSAKKYKADNVIYSFAFCPFLNNELTEKLLQNHDMYKSEYTFADGFPYGVAPEILDKGLCNILAELIKTRDELKENKVSKTSIFDLLKTDINSFEIETEISENDWRLYRFDFSCDKKENFISTQELYKKTICLPESDKNDIQKICQIAATEVKVLKTIPGYFNIQICKDYKSKSPYCAYSKFENFQKENMSFENFKNLLSKIVDLNPDAVLSLSLWGDPVLHSDFFKFCYEVVEKTNLTLLIETDGCTDFIKKLSQAGEFSELKILSEKVKNLPQRKNGFSPLIWIVHVDAMSQDVYEKIHPGLKLENAIESVKQLNLLFPKNVYAQYLRITENEDELESFYRTYKEQNYISSGNFIIQKYDHFCKLLPECKSADLSPVDRLPCWHLRRDMNILCDGSVVTCQEKSFEENVGSCFTEELLDLWNKTDSVLQQHIKKSYCKGCECCDEFYTYNF